MGNLITTIIAYLVYAAGFVGLAVGTSWLVSKALGMVAVEPGTVAIASLGALVAVASYNGMLQSIASTVGGDSK